MSPAASLETEVLAEITPTADEDRALQSIVAELEAQAQAAMAEQRLPGRAAVQGSTAKDTWLRGGADIDLFLLLDPSVPVERLESAAVSVGTKVLPDARKKYAQHPYLSGTFRDHAVDLVPAYAVASAGAKMSAVDRTPFHTAWVRAHLDVAARGQVRLAKRWLRGVGAYGAQTALGGFSGYLVEVLVGRFGSFPSVLDWLAADAKPRRLAVPAAGQPGPDQVKDDVSPLVVVDPVDPARNCAAAVTATTLALACGAARAYQAAPDRRFFFPAAPRAEGPGVLHSALSSKGSLWTGVLLAPQAARMDIVFPQFQRAVRTLTSGLEAAGFQVRATDVALSDAEDEVFVQWVTGGALPERRTHRGPFDDTRPNAAQFRAKWTGHADALGPVRSEGGLLVVDVAVRLRTPADWLRARLPTEPMGKHAEAAARDAQVLDDATRVPAAWAPRVADAVLGRRPWER
ncbi:MAG: CCA tRNA nucleotidyltransferase [Candidatus Thermoplasmatota archaeon]